ncbi:MAG: hypothetical protein R8M45_05040 [Ghiorsea sp.]
MNTIQSGWKGFEKAVVPKDSPKVQYNEMRKAFYAGASHILMLSSDLADLADRSEDAAVAVLQQLHEEAGIFANNGGE